MRYRSALNLAYEVPKLHDHQREALARVCEQMGYTDAHEARHGAGSRWIDQARCRDETKPDVFYTLKQKEANEVINFYCRRCPVAARCLTYAFEHESRGRRFGIYGGTTADQRRRIATMTGIL